MRPIIDKVRTAGRHCAAGRQDIIAAPVARV